MRRPTTLHYVTVPTDPCGEPVSWSIVDVATTSSTLAGVLAGFSIMSAVVLFASFRRINAYSLGLFLSSVLILALSSYIFSAITGVDFDGSFYPRSERCSQLWSQGLSGFGLLVTGIASLTCGLGWLLANYAEHLAKEEYEVSYSKYEKGRLSHLELQESADKILIHRKFLLRLNGSLCAGIMVTSTALLMAWSLVYLRALRPPGKFYYDGVLDVIVVQWLAYTFLTSVYVVSLRTTSAINAIDGASVIDRTRNNKAKIYLQISTLLIFIFSACKLSSKLVVSLYILAAECGLYGGVVLITVFVRIYLPNERLRRIDGPDIDQNALACDKLRTYFDYTNDRGILVRLGKMPQTIYSIVLLGILATLWAVYQSQRPGLAWARVDLSIWLGALCPASMLLMLACSVPSFVLGYHMPNWLEHYPWFPYIRSRMQKRRQAPRST